MRETGRPRTTGGAGQSVERASCWSSADCLLSFCPTFSTTSLTTNHNHSTFVSTLADFDHFQPKWVACTVSVQHNARRARSIGVHPCVAFCSHRRLNPYRRQSSGIAQCIDVPEPDLIALVGGAIIHSPIGQLVVICDDTTRSKQACLARVRAPPKYIAATHHQIRKTDQIVLAMLLSPLYPPSLCYSQGKGYLRLGSALPPHSPLVAQDHARGGC